jgi:hypothetical protein
LEPHSHRSSRLDLLLNHFFSLSEKEMGCPLSSPANGPFLNTECVKMTVTFIEVFGNQGSIKAVHVQVEQTLSKQLPRAVVALG